MAKVKTSPRASQRTRRASDRCPNCGGDSLNVFYEVRQIPVHSCLLMSTREEALAFPRDDLELGFCPACGFITNRLFDVVHNKYSIQYEETQGFSPTFNAFANSLACDLVDRHRLHGKTILEIGCGKGEFLAAMCEYGECRGIGIDPAFRPERMTSPAANRIEWIQDLYDRRYAHLKADCIVCRHTLEHIAPTQQFIAELRETIGDNLDTLIFFELPDVRRILIEGAFWDIYYEHCSYFSAGSLSRLFRAGGFDVTSIERAYDDQYLLLTSNPADGPTIPAHGIEDDLNETAQLMQSFPKRAAIQDFWRDAIARRMNGSTILWGSGSKGVSFITTLGLGGEIDRVVDVNPHRHGKFMPGSGHEIVSPAALASSPPDTVIVMNPIYVDEITADLAKMDLSPEILAVGRDGAD